MTDLIEKAEAGTARAVCFTLQHPNDEALWLEYKLRLSKLVETGEATYVVFQEEVAPSTKKVHLQGYIEFKNACRLMKINKLCSFAAHCEKRKGTAEQAANYCKKDDTRKSGTNFAEYGVISKGQGARTDLASIRLKLDDRKISMRSIAEDNFSTWVKYNKAFTQYRQLICTRRSLTTVCIVMWGESNCGKSANAFALFPDNMTVQTGNSGTWWCKYEQQEACIADEFSGWLKFNEFKRIVDRYPFTVDAKGTTLEFNSRFMIFTSNQNPQDWYTKTVESETEKEAFTRRLHINLEAYKAKGLMGREETKCRPNGNLIIPYGANMRPKWRLHGLTDLESLELIAYETTDKRRAELAQWCNCLLEEYVNYLVAVSQGHDVTKFLEMSRSAGVILSPALVDQSLPFYASANKFLTSVLLDTYDGVEMVKRVSDVPKVDAAQPGASSPSVLPPATSGGAEPSATTPMDTPMDMQAMIEEAALQRKKDRAAWRAKQQRKRAIRGDWPPGNQQDMESDSETDEVTWKEKPYTPYSSPVPLPGMKRPGLAQPRPMAYKTTPLRRQNAFVTTQPDIWKDAAESCSSDEPDSTFRNVLGGEKRQRRRR